MHMLNINNAMPKSKIEFITDVRFVLFLVCLYIFVYECLFQNNIAGVPSSRATSGSPQYCASTCARFFCTRHASCVDSKPKKKCSVITLNQKPKVFCSIPCLFVYLRLRVSSNPRSIAGVPFNSAGRFWASLLLRTTCMRS